MGLLRWLFGLFGGSGPNAQTVIAGNEIAPPVRAKTRWRRPVLSKFRHRRPAPADSVEELLVCEELPYAFAPPAIEWGAGGLFSLLRKKRRYLDLSQDIDHEHLARFGLPPLATPQDVADWLEMPLGQVAWLTGRFVKGRRPPSVKAAHYHFCWKPKKTGGARLLESPKPLLRAVQRRILTDILNRVPPHPAAHGFVAGRGILTNATPHVGQAILVKWDLANFYASVRYNRVVAIFRSLGYSREAALWLARLTTSAIPADLPIPPAGAHALTPYQSRHLPQGACTSPALANLSAYSLDVRLAGLAASFGGRYTRYADDLTMSGDEKFARNLRNVIPLVEAIVRSERFKLHPTKRRVLRPGRRQCVTGVVVNVKPNVRRDEFDRLKATLHNAARHGASSQNRDAHADFAAHLRGRIAHVSQLNPARGEKLMRIYERIDFGGCDA